MSEKLNKYDKETSQIGYVSTVNLNVSNLIRCIESERPNKDTFDTTDLEESLKGYLKQLQETEHTLKINLLEKLKQEGAEVQCYYNLFMLVANVEEKK